jgi:hypothetical protein
MNWELPFTRDAFFQVFADYNNAIWPAQALAYVIGVSSVAAMLVQRPIAGRIVLCLLATLWLFTGVVYQGDYFAAINPSAKVFALGFVAQAVLLLWCAFSPGARSFSRGSNQFWAWGLAIFSLFIYPALGAAFGHVFPAAPTFGVTLGLERAPGVLFVAPLLWAAVGSVAAFKLGVTQDWALPLSAIVAVWRRSRQLVAR